MKRSLAITLLLLALVVPAGCMKQFLYHPAREITATPARIGLVFETVSFSAQDGVRLSGWWVPANPQRGVLLFCHGNAGNISNRLDSILIFHQLGLSVFIFDYRGFGLSEGSPNEQGTYLDAEAAWDYLNRTRHISPECIILFGRSLGGAVAARLGVTRSNRALILESAFTSVQDVARDHFSWIPGFFLSGYRYDTLGSIREYPGPVLVVHSPDDEVVPFKHGLALYRAVQGPKQFLEIHGSHNAGFLQSRAGYENGLHQFSTSVFRDSATCPSRLN